MMDIYQRKLIEMINQFEGSLQWHLEREEANLVIAKNLASYLGNDSKDQLNDVNNLMKEALCRSNEVQFEQNDMFYNKTLEYLDLTQIVQSTED